MLGNGNEWAAMTGGHGKRRGRWGAAVLAGVLVSATAWPVASSADDVSGAAVRLAAVQFQVNSLQQTLDGLGRANSNLPFTGAPMMDRVPADGATGAIVAPVRIAQASRDVGALNVRLSQLEEQVRSLTGQVQGLQFQLTQMQTLVENMQADTDARLSTLEGSKPGKNKATSQPSGATPSGGGSQPLDLTAPAGEGAAPPVDESQIVIDPKAEGYTLGAPAHPLGTLTLDQLNSSGAGSPDGTGPIVTEADAAAQYKAGYDAVVRGDYAFAEEQFRQFIALFPDNPRAADATNWLGEALIRKGQYDNAADVLLNGYQEYPDSPRAPDILLKLAIALSGAGEQETACRTFAEVEQRYPNQPKAFIGRLAAEKAKAGCT